MADSLWQRDVLVFPCILANSGSLLLPGCSEMASTDREEVGVFPFSDPSLCSITALMVSEVPGADVTWDQRWGFWPLLPSSSQLQEQVCGSCP